MCRLLDIALLPQFRSLGIGGRLISELIDNASATGRPVRLSVLCGNLARSLYERLGFVITNSGPVYLEMECKRRIETKPRLES